MKRAEIVLKYMDQLKTYIELLNSYVEKGMTLLDQAQEWIRKIIEMIDKGIDYLVNAVGGRPDSRQLDDHLFV